jgi:hypothetical protein
LISNLMEDQLMSDAPPPTQDGGRCGDLEITMLPVRRVKF